MTDIVDRETRSRIMSAIRAKDTGPERALRHALHARGLRYGLHGKGLRGRPDLVFRRFGAVVFVHGCFWHRHADCRHASTPATRPEYWQAKFDANVKRDRAVRAELAAAGWRVATVWACALGTPAGVAASADLVEAWLRSDAPLLEFGADGLPAA